MSKKHEDLIGKKFNRLLVTAQLRFTKDNYILWECLCDCGNIIHTISGNLKKGNTKSCGCIRSEYMSNKMTKEPGRHGFTILKNDYKKSARKRNLIWNLDEKQLMLLFKNNCYYCGDEPSLITKGRDCSLKAIENSKFIYNGIDRLDNSIGYEEKNCVSCCNICNSMKSNFTSEQFFDKIKKIYKKLEKK